MIGIGSSIFLSAEATGGAPKVATSTLTPAKSAEATPPAEEATLTPTTLAAANECMADDLPVPEKTLHPSVFTKIPRHLLDSPKFAVFARNQAGRKYGAATLAWNPNRITERTWGLSAWQTAWQDQELSSSGRYFETIPRFYVKNTIVDGLAAFALLFPPFIGILYFGLAPASTVFMTSAMFYFPALALSLASLFTSSQRIKHNLWILVAALGVPAITITFLMSWAQLAQITDKNRVIYGELSLLMLCVVVFLIQNSIVKSKAHAVGQEFVDYINDNSAELLMQFTEGSDENFQKLFKASLKNFDSLQNTALQKFIQTQSTIESFEKHEDASPEMIAHVQRLKQKNSVLAAFELKHKELIKDLQTLFARYEKLKGTEGNAEEKIALLCEMAELEHAMETECKVIDDLHAEVVAGYAQAQKETS